MVGNITVVPSGANVDENSNYCVHSLICPLDPKYFKEVSKYVNNRMKEIIDSGIDKNTQQLKIAVLTCMNITDEYFTARQSDESDSSEAEQKISSLIELIDDSL